jgi:hypothetical protein
MSCNRSEFLNSRPFQQAIIRRNRLRTVVQEKVLSLIQAWSETFANQQHLSGVVQVYNELKSKGIEFPAADPEHTVSFGKDSYCPRFFVRLSPLLVFRGLTDLVRLWLNR